MPRPHLRHRHQRAVLWPSTGVDAYGQARVADVPEEVMVRWVPRRTEALDAQGNTVSVDATANVDRRITPGSLMWLGALADLPTNGNFGPPFPEDFSQELMEVVGYNETPDLKGRSVARSVTLKRYRDTLPSSS